LRLSIVFALVASDGASIVYQYSTLTLAELILTQTNHKDCCGKNMAHLP